MSEDLGQLSDDQFEQELRDRRKRRNLRVVVGGVLILIAGVVLTLFGNHYRVAQEGSPVVFLGPGMWLLAGLMLAFLGAIVLLIGGVGLWRGRAQR